LRVLGSVVAPATLITALLYYFGWTATHASAAYLGIDESLLSFSTQDYLLRSVNPVFWPLAVGLIVAALALHGHIRVMRYIRHPEPRVRIVWIIGALALVSVVAVTYGALALHYDWVSRGSFSVAPLSLTLGVAVFSYAVFIHEVATAHAKATPATSPAGAGSLAAVAIALLIAVGLFWQVADWATAVGVGKTRDLVNHLDAQPSVTLYSAKRLALAGPDGVSETTLPGNDAAYRYRYTGLRLLFRSGGKYLLLSDQWTRADGRTFLIDDTPEVRLDFSPDQ
jgi:uncharacterized membrane protein YidH (DUF202 family)